jgi:hypothetical protein
MEVTMASWSLPRILSRLDLVMARHLPALDGDTLRDILSPITRKWLTCLPHNLVCFPDCGVAVFILVPYGHNALARACQVDLDSDL